VQAVHFHGVGPCLLGARAHKGSPLHARAVYYPHLSHAASPFAAAVLRRLLQSRLDAKACAAVTASPTDAHLLSRLLDRSTEVLPQPVAQVYFTARQESTRPRILAAGTGDEAFDVLSRLCVLLNGREARVGFAWLGTAPAGKRAQLEAAGVEVLALEQDAERAEALSHASAFIYLSSGNRLPVAVAQAMAAGVPCLVSNTPAHRALVCHGETGFVCTSERDFLDKLVLLLRERAERRYIGEAARAEAARRFTLRHFERALLRAYGFTRPAPVAVLPLRGTQARA
jgi:glycosyltransferase involved in cell wall biosynthesis